MWWIDSVARITFRTNADGDALEKWTSPSIVGSIALATGMPAALGDGFYALDLGSGRFNPNVLPEYGNPYVRFNDGNADRQGRFLSGTMQLGEAIEAPGKLYRLEPDGSTSVFERGLAVSNSLCFSPSGDALYLADSI